LLDQERTARSTAEQRIADAEKRVKKARDAAAAATRQLERTKRRSGGGRKTKATRAKEAAASVRAVVEPHVESVTARATDAVEHLTSN
jgi:hypothetical protein